MPIPSLTEKGELPVGVHRATIEEVIEFFGAGTTQREDVTNRLKRIFSLATSTGQLDRLVIFGSYITNKAEPNDIDVVLVFKDSFDLNQCPDDTKALLDHQRTEKTLGASVFWIRPSLLILETLDEFIAHWQIKRDNSNRGIIEVFP